MGIGGGFLMTIYLRQQQEAITLNARETAPGAATADMYHGDHVASSVGKRSQEARTLYRKEKVYERMSYRHAHVTC